MKKSIHPAVAALIIVAILGIAGFGYWRVWNYKEPQRYGIQDLGKAMQRQGGGAPSVSPPAAKTAPPTAR